MYVPRSQHTINGWWFILRKKKTILYVTNRLWKWWQTTFMLSRNTRTLSSSALSHYWETHSSEENNNKHTHSTSFQLSVLCAFENCSFTVIRVDLSIWLSIKTCQSNFQSKSISKVIQFISFTDVIHKFTFRFHKISPKHLVNVIFSCKCFNLMSNKVV